MGPGTEQGAAALTALTLLASGSDDALQSSSNLRAHCQWRVAQLAMRVLETMQADEPLRARVRVAHGVVCDIALLPWLLPACFFKVVKPTSIQLALTPAPGADGVIKISTGSELSLTVDGAVHLAAAATRSITRVGVFVRTQKLASVFLFFSFFFFFPL